MDYSGLFESGSPRTRILVTPSMLHYPHNLDYLDLKGRAQIDGNGEVLLLDQFSHLWRIWTEGEQPQQQTQSAQNATGQSTASGELMFPQFSHERFPHELRLQVWEDRARGNCPDFAPDITIIIVNSLPPTVAICKGDLDTLETLGLGPWSALANTNSDSRRIVKSALRAVTVRVITVYTGVNNGLGPLPFGNLPDSHRAVDLPLLTRVTDVIAPLFRLNHMHGLARVTSTKPIRAADVLLNVFDSSVCRIHVAPGPPLPDRQNLEIVEGKLRNYVFGVWTLGPGAMRDFSWNVDHQSGWGFQSESWWLSCGPDLFSPSTWPIQGPDQLTADEIVTFPEDSALTFIKWGLLYAEAYRFYADGSVHVVGPVAASGVFEPQTRLWRKTCLSRRFVDSMWRLAQGATSKLPKFKYVSLIIPAIEH